MDCRLSRQINVLRVWNLKNGESGYVIPSENTVLLTEKINLILRDDSMRQRMAENALNTIRKYTIENMVKSHIEVLE